MTDAERLKKLRDAVGLIREVEFSYPVEHPTRKMIYSVVIDSFSFTKIGSLMTQLKEKFYGQIDRGEL